MYDTPNDVSIDIPNNATYVKGQFVIISSNYRKPVSSILKEKIERTLGAAK